MNTTSLLAEFLVVGVLPFWTLVFSVLSILGVYDFGAISQLKDFSALLAVMSTLAVYLLGALTYRMTQLLNFDSLRFLLKRKAVAGILGLSSVSPTKEWFADYLLVYRHSLKVG